MTVGKLWSVTLDCAEPGPLAAFWAAVLGGKEAYSSEKFIGVEMPDGPTDPGEAFGAPDRLRLSFGAEDAVVVEAARRIRAAC